ncbi:MAG: carboxypeptidase-like regulatory domain-containing protein, partial [Balneolaceae bacterium]|nr:carboxypeptidase-like regulatory domain-containing protein [Balneolaceae bacterium]
MNKIIRFTLVMILFVLANRVLLAQNGTIRGTVIEEASGDPVYGVTVLVEGTSTGTTTDFDGKFDLSLSEG